MKNSLKRIEALVLVLIMLLSAVPLMSASAESVTADGFGYEITEGEAVITSYSGSFTEIVIPSEIEGVPVRSIRSYAFYNKTNLTSVTIPEGVKTVEAHAFRACRKLTSLTLPSTLEAVGERAFSECEILPSIVIPEGVKSLGKNAFSYCRSLTSLSIPKSLETIGEGAFEGTWFVESITVHEDNEVYDSRDNSNAIIETKTNTLVAGCKNTLIPRTVTRIGNSAFSICRSLKEIYIPESVEYIGDRAFNTCANLQLVNIPKSVKEIGDWAFYSCKELKDITFNQGLVTIGDYAFSYCESLETAVLPQGLESVGVEAFNLCTCLQNLTFPETIEKIGNGAFKSCESIVALRIPESLTSIGNNTFRDCKRLSAIYIPLSVKSIGDYAFDGCTALKHVFFEGSKNQWFGEVLRGINNTGVEDDHPIRIQKLFFDSRIQENGLVYRVNDSSEIEISGIMETCDEVEIPAEINSLPVKSISFNAFASWPYLVSVSLPEGLALIDEHAFYGCVGLSSVNIPKSVERVGMNAFWNTAYYNNSTNWDEDGVLYLDGVILEASKLMKGHYSIREGTRLIGDNAFAYCTVLESVTVPEGVSRIGKTAFDHCGSFAEITVPAELKAIDDSAFYGCDALSDVYYGCCDVHWAEIAVSEKNNETFTGADIHYKKTSTRFTDYATGILVRTIADAELRVLEASADEIADMNFILEGEEIVRAFDITLMKDETAVQPHIEASVKIPAEDGSFRVYRIEEDGSLTDMNARFEDGFMVFTTEHFSLYLLTKEKLPEIPTEPEIPSEPERPTETEPENPSDIPSEPQPENSTDPEETYLLGDVNLDGKVNVKDATIIQKSVAGLISLTEEENLSADANLDEKVNIKDATAIQKFSAGLETGYPIGKERKK